MQEHRIPSPIKLVENFKSKENNQRERFAEDEGLYREQNQLRAVQEKYEDSRDNLERPPVFRKEPSPTKTKKPPKYENEANSSSDEDELAIAQKWLNLRRQKIERINQELSENRNRNEIPTHDTQHNAIPRGESQPRRYEEEMRKSQETRAPRGLREPKMQLNELGDEGWTRGSPVVKELRSAGFSSAQKGHNTILDDKEFFKKRAASSASKVFNINPITSPGVVNLNQMNVEELIQLKKMLDEKINNEKQMNPFENSQNSQGKSFERPQHLSFHSPTAQEFSDQPTYVDTTKSASSAYYSGRMENDYSNYQNRFGRVPARIIHEEPQYERRVEYREPPRQEVPVDTSLMRDFDSIAHTLHRGATEFSKEQYEPVPQVNEESRTEEDSLEVDAEKLYEEKLKEFLKVRERMLKTNKIRDQGIQIESILKSTLKDSKNSNKSRENHLTVSTQRQRNLNSPPSMASLGRPDTAKLSEKDFMLSQELVRHGLQEGLNFMQHNRFARDEIHFEARRLDSEAKTPDYGYGRSQASVKSSRHPESEEEVEELTDDFYDDKLFDLVEDIEKQEIKKENPPRQRKSEAITVTSRARGSEVDNEFNSLFNTVKFFQSLIFL